MDLIKMVIIFCL